MDDARCQAQDLNGFRCVLEVDHPGDHAASRVVVAWVDETTLSTETIPLERAPLPPLPDTDLGRRLAALSDDERRAWDEWVREHPSLNEIQLAWQLEPWLHKRRVGPEVGARHIAEALVLGAGAGLASLLSPVFAIAGFLALGYVAGVWRNNLGLIAIIVATIPAGWFFAVLADIQMFRGPLILMLLVLALAFGGTGYVIGHLVRGRQQA